MAFFARIAFMVLCLLSFLTAQEVSKALRCSASCLKKYKYQLTGEEKAFLQGRPDLIQPHCIKNSPNCLTCLQVCDWNNRQTQNCTQECQLQLPLYQDTCVESCQRVRSLQLSRAGVCPKPTEIKSRCISQCKKDIDCYRPGSKCCATSNCGKLCLEAIPVTIGIPPVPSKAVVKQTPAKSNDKQVVQNIELDWSQYKLAEWPDPVVFLVQIRSYVGSNVDDRLLGPWADLVRTTKLGAVLSDLQPGTWYQIRLFAYSSQGSAGPGTPTQPFRIRAQPRVPSPPRDIEEVSARIQDGAVDITLHWQSPLRVDIPLKKYKISWKRHYGYIGGEQSSVTEYSAAVPGDKLKYSVRGLLPDTTYKVEVYAVSVFDSQDLTSDPASLYIRTLKIPEPPPSGTIQDDYSFEESEKKDGCLCKWNQDAPISLQKPYYENGDLKLDVQIKPQTYTSGHNLPYVLEWGPRVCIENALPKSGQPGPPYKATVYDNQKFHLSHLKFQCHYQLKIRLSGGSYTEWDTCFCTPSCRDVHVTAGAGPEKCGVTDAPVPGKPENVEYEMTSDHDGKHVRVKVTWRPPLGQFSALRGYRLVWGPRLFEPIDEKMYSYGLSPQLDSKKAQSKVLATTNSRFIMSELAAGTLYIVQIQSIGKRGDSPVETVFFTTPGDAKTKVQVKSSSSKINIFTVTYYIFWIHIILTTITSS